MSYQENCSKTIKLMSLKSKQDIARVTPLEKQALFELRRRGISKPTRIQIEVQKDFIRQTLQLSQKLKEHGKKALPKIKFRRI